MNRINNKIKDLLKDFPHENIKLWFPQDEKGDFFINLDIIRNEDIITIVSYSYKDLFEQIENLTNLKNRK